MEYEDFSLRIRGIPGDKYCLEAAASGEFKEDDEWSLAVTSKEIQGIKDILT